MAKPHHRDATPTEHKKLAPLGSGKRFASLENKLAHRPGVTDPGALAAAIGREKFGAKRFARLGAKGK